MTRKITNTSTYLYVLVLGKNRLLEQASALPSEYAAHLLVLADHYQPLPPTEASDAKMLKGIIMR